MNRTRGISFAIPFVVTFVAFIIAPLAYAIYLSFYRDQMVGGNVFVGLDNYVRAIGDELLRSGIGRVLLFLVIQVPIMLTLAVVAALALDSGRMRFLTPIRLGLFAPYAVPSVVAAMMWGYIYGGQFGLTGQISHALGVPLPNLLSSGWLLTSIGNVVTWEFLGYDMLIFFAALQTIPKELYEAAAMDGAGEIRKAWSIKLPALRPALALAVVFSTIGSLQLVNEPIVLQPLAPSVITTNYTPNLYAYSLAFNGEQFNYSAAVSVVIGLVIIGCAAGVQILSRGRRWQPND